MTTTTEPTRDRALQEASARLRLLIESIQGGLTILEGSRIVYVNSQLCQMLGYGREELKRMGELDWAAPEEREQLEQALEEAHVKGLPLEEQEFWAVCKDGSRRLVRNRYATGMVGDGVPFRLVVTLDLTERELAQQAALQREELLQWLVGASQALAAAEGPEGMLRAAVDPAMKVGPGTSSGAHAAVLMAVDLDVEGRPEWARVLAAVGQAAALAGVRFYLPVAARADSLLSGTDGLLLVPDIRASDHGMNEQIARMMQSIHARAVAILPLRSGQQWQGIVAIAWPEQREFLPEEKRLYELLASILAVRLQAHRQRQETEHRAVWSQTAAEISRAASTVLDTEELLQRAVDLVQERFALYYAGLFLVDQDGAGDDGSLNWAVLQVGTGEAGLQMVEQGHRLEIGGGSMIGQCVATKQPRIAMDVGKEPVRFANPLLPDTRTELALPLVSRGQALGALTIQSRQEAAFSVDDITVLQTMADQLAVAIDNAHLIQRARDQAEWEQRVRAISDQIHRSASAEAILQTTLVELGKMLAAPKGVIRLGSRASLMEELEDRREPHAIPTGNILGYYRDGDEGGPTVDAWLPAMTPAVLDGHTVLEAEPAATAAIPIESHGEMIGVAGFSREQAGPWSEGEIAAAQAIVGEVAEALDRQHLLDETERRAWQLETSNEIGRAISTTLDMETLLRQIVDTIKSRLGYYFVAIMLIEGDQIVFQHGSTIGDSGSRLEPRSKAMGLEASTGMIVQVANSGQPLLANDVLNDPRYFPIPEMPATRSELDVPIIVAGKVIGVLDVQSDLPGTYTQDDLILLQALANQAGVAIENARLFHEAQSYAEEQTILRQISETIGESLAMQEMLERTLDVVLPAIGFEAGLVSLSREEGGDLYIAAHRGLPEVLARKLQMDGLRGTLCDHVYQTGESTGIPDVREGAPVDASGVIRVGLLSYAGVPVLHTDRRLGTFCFFDSNVHHLDDRDMRMLETIGRQVGIGVANARLYEQTQKALADAQAAHGSYLRRGWQQHLRRREMLGRSGFVYESPGPESDEATVAAPDLWRPEMGRAVEGLGPGAITSPDEDHERSGVAVPIRLRGQVLGVMGVETDGGERQWTEEEIALLAAVSEQLGQALESARLFADTERSAERERLIGEITAKIRASTDVRDILRTTAEELGQVLRTSRALVQVAPPRPGSGSRGDSATQEGPSSDGRESADDGQGQRED